MYKQAGNALIFIGIPDGSSQVRALTGRVSVGIIGVAQQEVNDIEHFAPGLPGTSSELCASIAQAA